MPAIVVAGILGAALVSANPPSEKLAAPLARFTWTPPTEGTPVDHYIAEIEVNESGTLSFGPLAQESVTIPVAYGNKYRVRVAAVDAQGRQGPMSLWSEPYAPELDPPAFNP